MLNAHEQTKIELAIDAFGTEAKDFTAWLNAHGYDASVGTTTGSYVDGRWTNNDEQARATLESLWDDFCNS